MRNNLSKAYRIENLCSGHEALAHRIGLIEAVTSQTPAPVSFVRLGDRIYRLTRRLRMASHCQYGRLTHDQAQSLAKLLDQCYQHGLVHGDINRKNLLIIPSGELVLVDWEPDLKQIVHNRTTWMMTPPWWCPNDRAANTLSVRTDLLCYWKVLTDADPHDFANPEWRRRMASALSQSQPFQTLFNQWCSHALQGV